VARVAKCRSHGYYLRLCCSRLTALSRPGGVFVPALLAAAMIVAPEVAPLLLVAGAFHGYAYGESIVGAEPAPLAAYLAGFALIQGCIAVGSAAALRWVAGRGYVSEAVVLRTAGGAIALAAAFAFVGVVLTG